MAKTARERLGVLLGGSTAVEFSARLEAPADGVGLEVAGVGPVRLPLRAPQVKKLIAVARPALFGRGEDTLSDSGVRDTWQIPPDQVTLGGPAWPTLLDGALEYFRDELGLPAPSRLRAEPHALLVYGKGQFFLPHQDSEKDDAMVGSLVLPLPSAHTGGELVIRHAGQSRTYRASKTELSLVAFYADCPHEVTQVRSGYRVTLTFNLLAAAGSWQRRGPTRTRSSSAYCRCCATRRGNRGRASPPAAGLGAVARECGDRLGALARRAPRAADDGSVAWTGCGCDLCGTLGAFLSCRSRRTLEWPLAKDGRRHVHGRIDTADLPVDHQTRRQGRPYTLVLTKTPVLARAGDPPSGRSRPDLAGLGMEPFRRGRS